MDLNLPSLNVKLTIAPVIPTDDVNCKDQIWDPNPRYKWTEAQKVQNNEFIENGLENWALVNQTTS